jgi:trigger factor
LPENYSQFPKVKGNFELEVTESEVTKEIENLKERFAVFTDVAEPIAAGHIATLNFQGFIDKKPFRGGSAKDFRLEIGKGIFLPTFEENIMGMQSGETKRFSLQFPENYLQKEFASKNAEFQVTIIKVQQKSLPNETTLLNDLQVQNQEINS